LNTPSQRSLWFFLNRCVTFPLLRQKLWHRIPYLMNRSFWSFVMTYGTEILSSISKPKLFGLIFLVQIIIVSGIKPVNTLSSVIPFTTMVLIPYFYDVSPTMKLRKIGIIVTLEHVAVICLGMLLPKRSYKLVIFGLHCLRITLMSSINSMLVKPTTIRFNLTLLLFTL
jgi:hypothetical protein